MGKLIKKLTCSILPPAQYEGLALCKFIFFCGLLYAAINRFYYLEEYAYSISFFEVPFKRFLLESLAISIRSKKIYLIAFECVYIFVIFLNLLAIRPAWAKSLWTVPISFIMLILQLLNMIVFSPNNIASETTAHYFLILFFFTELSKIHSSRRLRVLHFLAGIRSIQLQLVVVYFFCGLTKIISPPWFKGVALTYIFKIGYVSTYNLQIFDKFPLINNISTYATIAFECLFFSILLFPRLRPLIIFFGITMHVLIGPLLSYLWDITLTTLSVYCLFIDWRSFFAKNIGVNYLRRRWYRLS